MDRPLIERLAREAGLPRPGDPRAGYERFASLVANECAKVCESVNNHDNPMTANDCADAIRDKFRCRPSFVPPGARIEVLEWPKL